VLARFGGQRPWLLDGGVQMVHSTAPLRTRPSAPSWSSCPVAQRLRLTQRAEAVYIQLEAAVACITTGIARVGDPARATYTQQIRDYVAVITDLIDNPQAGQRDAILTVSALVGAMSMARRRRRPRPVPPDPRQHCGRPHPYRH